MTDEPKTEKCHIAHKCCTDGNCAGGWPVYDGECTFCGGYVPLPSVPTIRAEEKEEE